MKTELYEIVDAYKDVIKKFKQRSDVMDGKAIGWRGRSGVLTDANRPKGIGDGLGTTGWCVSASEALLKDGIFQTLVRYRGAFAKLISIDIKEQYWGYCYTGSQNKWHTAILVKDGNVTFVIDITCRQFGNSFIDKDIWDFQTWQDTLRSPLCKHKLTDFDLNPLTITPIVDTNPNYRNVLPIVDRMHALKDFTGLSGADRALFTKYLLEDFHTLNAKLITKTVSANDMDYLDEVTRVMADVPFVKYDEAYAVLEFASKDACKNWITLLMENNYQLHQYIIASKSIEESCKLNGININNMFSESQGKRYLILKFKDIYGVDTTQDLLLGYGVQLVFESGYNAGKEVDKDYNTTYMTFI